MLGGYSTRMLLSSNGKLTHSVLKHSNLVLKEEKHKYIYNRIDVAMYVTEKFW